MGGGLPSVGFSIFQAHKLTQPHLTNTNHQANSQPKPPKKPTSQDAPSQHQVTFTAHIHPEFYGPSLRTSDSAKRQSASKPVPGLGSAGNSEKWLPGPVQMLRFSREIARLIKGLLKLLNLLRGGDIGGKVHID